jgi:hypothetical protein
MFGAGPRSDAILLIIRGGGDDVVEDHISLPAVKPFG